jgi:hypothetical protein
MRKDSYVTSSWKGHTRLSWHFTSVKSTFTLGGLAGRNDADGVTFVWFAVTDQKQSYPRAHGQQQKTFLITRVFFIEELNGKFIIENGLRFFEGNTVLSSVALGLG